MRHRRARLTADVAAGRGPVAGRRGRPPTGGPQSPPGTHQPVRLPPEAWIAGVRHDEFAAADRPERGGLIAAMIAVLVVVAATVVGGTYLWRRHHLPPVAAPAECAVAAETLAQGATLRADLPAAAAWRAERDAAHQQIQQAGLQAAAVRYADYAVRIATGDPAAPGAAQRDELARSLPAHCRATLTVAWPAAP